MNSSSAILLSGGVDSTALAAVLKPQHAIFVDYGQTCAKAERSSAFAVASHLNIQLSVVEADCSRAGYGDLSGRPNVFEASPSSEWWPFRNQLLASLAGPKAITLGVDKLVFASVLSDDFHADGTILFFDALDRLMRSQEGGLGVEAPAINSRTEEIVVKSGAGIELFGWTHSCHVSNAPCGECNGCIKHMGVFHLTNMW